MTDTAPAVAVPDLSHRRVLLIIGALLMGMLLAALDQTIVSTALPTIVGDLHGGAHYAWVVTAYLLASTVSTPLWGKLGDLYGRKGFFQAAIVIFLIGSALSGFSHTMFELIAFRAVQGIGGGGLMIGAQAIVGDVVSPRERGRYMGLFGAVFGVATVIGPLLGGFFVEYLSWRWVFYINLPLGVIALIITGIQLPASGPRRRQVIDYLGTALLAVAATAFVLFTSLGGTTYRWGSGWMIGLAAIGVVSTGLFILAERRAAEPVMPLRLFSNRVFSASSAVGFVVGFAMFGALTFLPLYFQVVKGATPTQSGLRMLPVMGGLLAASIISGQLISRWGRYKAFPVIGTAMMTLGLYLLSTIGVATNGVAVAVYMVILGVGLGLVMQVLVVAVQNAVEFRDLGTATSGATFFRQIGGSFGTAVFGAIYANVLVSRLAARFPGHALPPGVASQAANAAALKKLPPDVYAGFIHVVATTIGLVFLLGVPIGIVAFGLSWLLPEVELRKTVSTVSVGESVPMPTERTSLKEVELGLERVTQRENRGDVYRRLAERAGVAIDPRACWLLYRLAEHPGSTVDEITAQLKLAAEHVEPGLASLAAAGLITRTTSVITITPAGEAALERLTAARRDGLTDLLAGYDPEAHPELMELVHQLATSLLADDRKLVADSRPVPTV